MTKRLPLWAAISMVGLLVRVVPIASSGFPLNDGGLFAAMIQAIRDAHFSLPEYVAYNGHLIPFAYPPLGLYLGAGISWFSDWPIPLVEQIVPVTVSVLTVPASYWVFRPMLRTRAIAAMATFVFAVTPRSYDWIIAGGGITRSFGLLLSLVVIGAAWRAGRKQEWRWPVAGGLALGLCGLSHPQAAVFATVSAGLLVFTGSHGLTQGLRRLSILGLTAAAVILPWLVLTLQRHGAETLMAAAGTGGNPVDGLLLLASARVSDGMYEVLGFACVFGLIVCLLNRQWLFPVWAVTVLVTGPRSGLTYASIPLAAAAAVGIQEALRVVGGQGNWDRPAVISSKWPSGIAVGALLLVSIVDSLASPNTALSPLTPISPTEQLAIQWIADNTPADARFLVISGEPWELDAMGEWLPYLTGRISTSTVQGTEWLGPGKFELAQGRHGWLLNCAALTAMDCVGEWSTEVGQVDFVLLADGHAARVAGHPCCLGMASQLMSSGSRLVFSATDVQIYSHEGPKRGPDQ